MGHLHAVLRGKAGPACQRLDGMSQKVLEHGGLGCLAAHTACGAARAADRLLALVAAQQTHRIPCDVTASGVGCCTASICRDYGGKVHSSNLKLNCEAPVERRGWIAEGPLLLARGGIHQNMSNRSSSVGRVGMGAAGAAMALGHRAALERWTVGRRGPARPTGAGGTELAISS